MSTELISSLYPLPPPYYKFFTDSNKTKYDEWLKSESDEAAVPPGDLRFHRPPSAPTGEQYRGYGSVWALVNKLPSLKELGWKQLYSDEDEKITSQTKIDELHKLLDSLLLNFLELLGSVSKEPAKFYVKIEDLKLLLINMNHLLNTYRPHQTRESLIVLLKKQIEKNLKDMNEIDEAMDLVKKRISKLLSANSTGAQTAPSGEDNTANTVETRDDIKKKLQSFVNDR